jgi:hypothetical protein
MGAVFEFCRVATKLLWYGKKRTTNNQGQKGGAETFDFCL